MRAQPTAMARARMAAHDHRIRIWRFGAIIALIALITPLTVMALSGPALSASPTATSPGSSVRISGTGFPKNETGQLLFDGLATNMPKYRANGKGTFAVTMTVPQHAAVGSHLVSARATSKKSPVAASTVAVVGLTVVETVPTPLPTPTPTPTPAPTTAPTTAPTPTAGPTATPTRGSDIQPSFPVRAVFYYPWFPEAWNQQGMNPFTKYHPDLGWYDSGSASVIRQHLAAMEYGKMSVGISSWWGQGSRTDGRVSTLLATTAGSSFRWTLYHEREGSGDPSVSELNSDLTYIRDRYGADPSFYRVGGRFVVFVYADALDGCAMADRWTQANAGVGAYVVLKVFSGYKTCANQPDGWHQYGPASAASSQAGYSYTISPGFDKANEATRLSRDLSRWNQNVRDMVASGAPFQLVTTFNEWGEGTSVEGATEWTTASGWGAYLDALHNDGSGGPVATPTSPPPATPAPSPGAGDQILLAAGDIAGCSTSGDEATARLLGTEPGTIVTLGDNVYDSGTAAEFENCFHPSWGQHKPRIMPSAGNHEYLTSGASGYFGYFGSAAGDPSKGYYAFELGSWRLYALNSNCSKVGGCGVGSPQEEWLRNDLAANPRTCVLAYWHHPRFSSGQHGSYTAYMPFWQALHNAGAEIVLSGHDHTYERFAPQTPSGTLDLARGIRQFVVGTGGKNHYPFSGSFIPNSEARNDNTFGILKLTLRANSYEWLFIPEAGKTFTDSGSGTCH